MKTVAGGDSENAAHATRRGTFLEVLGVFLKLGLTSFGGPIAHLGYFRAEFVAAAGSPNRASQIW